MMFVRKLLKLLSTISIVSIIVYGLIHLPELFGYHKLIIDSDNMKSIYSKGTIVYYYETNKINVGDIVSLMKDNNIVCGRVFSISNDGYIIKYDNTSKNDFANNKDILGRNINIIVLFLGPFVTFVNNNYILYGIICFIFIALNIIFNKRKVKHKKVLVIDE